MCHVSHVLHEFGKLKLGKTLAENADFTINFQLLSTFNFQLSTFNFQLSTFNSQLSTFNNQ